MLQAVDCDLLLYADDSCLVFGDNDVNELQKQLNRNCNFLCDWFADNILSIHFGEDKTKSILFGRKYKQIFRKNLDIRVGDIKIKQHNTRQSHTWAASWTRTCLVNQWLQDPW